MRLQRKQPTAVKVPPARAPLPAGAQGSHQPKLLQGKAAAGDAAGGWKMQGADRKRFVCLAGLLQTGLLHALLLHQLCGHPLGLQLPPPSQYYDGFAFLREYCHRWDARRAERRLRGGAPSTPRQPRDEERERTEEADTQDHDDAREELKLKEQVVKKEGSDDEEGDSTVMKARAAIVAGLRPHPDSAKQNERVGPSLFKPETTKQTNKKRRRKENNVGGSGAKEKERRDQDHGEEEGSDDQDADRLATHNSFALLG